MSEFIVSQIDEFKNNGHVIQRLTMKSLSGDEEITVELPPLLSNRFGQGVKVECEFHEVKANDPVQPPSTADYDIALHCIVCMEKDKWILSAGGLVIQRAPWPKGQKLEAGMKQWLTLKEK